METMLVPPLREDLSLYPGPVAHDGSPTWTIHDPLSNRFIRIGETAFQLLSFWHLGNVEAILSRVKERWGNISSPEEIAWLSDFIINSSLSRTESFQDVQRLSHNAKRGKNSWYQWLIHNYLFFRIPLVRPDHFLATLARLAAPLYCKWFRVLTVLVGVTGLLLVIRQWDTFIHTFLGFYSWQGLFWYFLAMSFAKLGHEFGHAVTAKRFGCHIPTMGIAFIVLWPVFYTDTGDAWKLAKRRQRLAIGLAGIGTELMLACFATFLWSFLPDGPARNATFLLATVTWTLTLAINLNPLMRYDGYYLLSDAWGVENLQTRAFALARWRLRKLLFGFNDAPPECFSSGLQLRLLIYGYTTWVYRFFLFLGIAVLVYFMFFKALGLLLFAIEISWFIGRPLRMELGKWWQKREQITLNRNTIFSLFVLLGGGLVLFFPWQNAVVLPAVLRGYPHAYLYAPVAAHVETVSLQRGDTVTIGDPLVSLSAPDLEREIVLARLRIDIAKKMVLREAAGSVVRQNIVVLRQRLLAERSRLAGLEKRKALLQVRAPVSGKVVEVAKEIHAGRWINETQPLGLIVGGESTQIKAYVTEQDLARITVGQKGLFIPDDRSRPMVETKIRSVAEINTEKLEEPYLASILGGNLPAHFSKQGELIPERSIYQVELETANHASNQVVRGVVRLAGERQAVVGNLWRHALAVLIRESGF